MFNTQDVAKAIRKARNAKNMTQMQLADEMNVSYQAVSNWERGSSMPDIGKLADLCRVLGIGLGELLGEAPKEQKIVEKVMMDEPVSLKEVAEIAPILPPETVGTAVREEEERAEIDGGIDMDTLLELAHFLDDEYLAKLAEKVAVKDPAKLVDLAPFLDDETLEDLTERYAGPVGKEITELAPFLSDEALDRLVKKELMRDGTDMEGLLELAPFLADETLDAIADSWLRKNPKDLSKLTAFAPFLSDEALRKIADRAIEGGDYAALRSITRFL